DNALRIAHAQRAIIARPDTIGADAITLDARKIDAALAQTLQRFLFGNRRVHKNANPLRLGEVKNDVGVHPDDRLELAGPVVALVRPGDPGGVVRFPFGGHVETASGGSGYVRHGGLVHVSTDGVRTREGEAPAEPTA